MFNPLPDEGSNSSFRDPPFQSDILNADSLIELLGPLYISIH